MITTHIVTSRDGHRFSIQFESRTQAQAEIAKQSEERFAKSKTASELLQHGDYHPVETLRILYAAGTIG